MPDQSGPRPTARLRTKLGGTGSHGNAPVKEQDRYCDCPSSPPASDDHRFCTSCGGKLRSSSGPTKTVAPAPGEVYIQSDVLSGHAAVLPSPPPVPRTPSKPVSFHGENRPELFRYERQQTTLGQQLTGRDGDTPERRNFRRLRLWIFGVPIVLFICFVIQVLRLYRHDIANWVEHRMQAETTTPQDEQP